MIAAPTFRLGGRDKGGRAATRVLLTAASLGLCLAGVAMVTQGAMVPVTAQVAQVELNRDFDRKLVENAQAGIAPVEAVAPTKLAKASQPKPKSLPRMVTAPLVTDAPAPVRLTEPAKSLPVAPGKPLARITVKRLGVRDVILAGPPSHDELAKGPMMVKRGDAESPVTVLAAHRDTHFLFIRDLREGDVVTMQYVTGETERYRVTWFQTVRWNEFAYPLDPPRPLLALTTCYPFGGTEYGGPWRRVAWAERIA